MASTPQHAAVAIPEHSSLLTPRDEIDVGNEQDVVYAGYGANSTKKKGVLKSLPFAWGVAAVLAVIAVALGVVLAVSAVRKSLACPANDHPSVVLFIGDGFGPQMTSLVRLFVNPDGAGDEPFAALNDPASHCQMSFVQTRSASAFVTDSAAAGTALASGWKTTNGYVGVRLDPRDPDTGKQSAPVGSVLEAAKLAGYATGVVVTSMVSHATPASFTAHVRSRDDYQHIALQQAVTQRDFVDLMIGGGRSYFEATSRRDKRDLLSEMRNSGTTVALTSDELRNATTLPLVALLESGHLGYRIDAPHSADTSTSASLRECVEKAVGLLRASGKPFFLMVEGSKIDMAEHSNDVAAAVHEAVDYLDSVNWAVEDAKKHGSTIVLSTSDHDTGGLSINKPVDMDLLHRINASSEFLARKLAEAGSSASAAKDVAKQYTTIELSDAEAEQIAQAKDKTQAFSEVVSSHLGVVWGTGDHTDTNVLLYSCFGGWDHSQACLDAGEGDSSDRWLPIFVDNTDIPKLVSARCHTSLADATERAVRLFGDDTGPLAVSTPESAVDARYHTMAAVARAASDE